MAGSPAALPALAAAAAAGALAAGAALVHPDPLALALAACLPVFGFAAWSAASRRALARAEAALGGEWRARKALHFVEDMEENGRAWFWETDADGALTYLSEAVARLLGRPSAELIGRGFVELLLVEDRGERDEERATLGFHLSARFPFSDVVVRPNGNESIAWALSGSPSFDEAGRFLGFRGIGTNLSERLRSAAEMTKRARFDSLTGMPNRAQMRETLEQALVNAAERRKGCALLLIDLDRFKHVNDTLGHPAGDALLQQVAKRLAEVVGNDGRVGRLGGDEFEAVLPGTDDEGHLAALCGRIIEQVSKPYLVKGHRVSVGASIGIAIARPGKTLADSLIKSADLALYAAKANGRGGFCFFAEEMHNQAADRQILEADLKGALAAGQMKLLFQPVFDARSEKVAGFEACLRWAHPTRGPIAPSRFLPLADECGLTAQVADWALRTACAEAARWPAGLRLAINVTPAQFSSPALLSSVTGALASSGLDPQRLELEITEAVFLSEEVATDDILHKLKVLGVRLTLDEFGTGHLSLGYFNKSALDGVKIDQSFIRGAQEDESRNAEIIRSVVALAASLGIETTGQGAESYDDLELIRRLGCSHVQGSVLGRPVSADEALQLALAGGGEERDGDVERAARHSIIRIGSLDHRGKTLEVRLRNISGGGAMVECDRGFTAGTKVKLDLGEAGRVDAHVRWTGKGRVGLQFAEEFDVARLGRTSRRRGSPAPGNMLRPDYLDTETNPESPWAGRYERLTLKDVRRS